MSTYRSGQTRMERMGRRAALATRRDSVAPGFYVENDIERLQNMTTEALCELYDELCTNRRPFVDYTEADATLHTISTILAEREEA
jgi:hypothetical protein